MRAPHPALRLARALTSLLLAVGAGLIAAGSLVYFTDERPPFLLEKLPLPGEALWLAAVRVHVVSAVLALPACLLLSWERALRKVPRVHRWLGRATALLILLGAVPSGFYLALFAKGGLPSTLGFWLSGAITAAAMVEAVRRARAGDFVAHRRAALHVLAQLSVAVTSRTMLVALAAIGWDETRSYLLSLWLPVVGSALLVEAARRPRITRRHHETDRDPGHPVRRLPRLGVTAG
jgi:uncharacterized membrane protein